MRRSFSGPLLLLGIGALFLWRNLHPEAPVFDILAQYWPFILIAWGVLRLIEGLIWHREGVRGSFSGGEIVLIILICIAGSGICSRMDGPPNMSFWPTSAASSEICCGARGAWRPRWTRTARASATGPRPAPPRWAPRPSSTPTRPYQSPCGVRRRSAMTLSQSRPALHAADPAVASEGLPILP